MADNMTYFAAREAKETASALLNKSQSFYNVLESNSYLDKLAKMWRAYHGAYNNDVGHGHEVNFAGEQGELVQLDVNHFRNLAQHMYNMITSNRLIMEARAVNTDYKSQAQTTLANAILEYYMREKRLEDTLKKAVEMSIVLGSAFVKLEWNATAGEVYDVDDETGLFTYEGEIESSVLSPFDVVFDGTKENWNQHDWLLVRSYQNRHNLIAKYPELAEQIRGLPSKTDKNIYRLAIWSNDDTDDVPVYEFYHRRSEAMPDGRYLLFLSEDIVLLDAKMPYRVLPIFRIAPNDILGTPYGYSPLFDVYPIQECINALFSTVMTNQNAFGVTNLFVPTGADLTITTLDGGLNIIKGSAKPEALNLTETPTEVFKFLEILIQQAETISGINSVARGNPEASLKSGTALALVQSMSIQFISGLQQSYVKLVENVGTALIQILKDYSTTPKVVALVGKDNRTYLKEFTGESVSSINRVIVDVGNALSRTVAGRVQMAEQMLQMKLLKTPQQYFQVMTTGRLDVAYEGDEKELLNIKRENEKMTEGKVIRALSIDNHVTHILEHRSVLADPDLRDAENFEIQNNVLNHIKEHIDLLETTDPRLLQILGEPSFAQPMQPQGGPMGGAPVPQGPQGAAPSESMVDPATMQNVELPQLPTPPAPFENMPVVAGDMIPPGGQ